MESTTYTLSSLFRLAVFHIPGYQRAYTWDKDPQLAAFLDDLRQQVRASAVSPDKTYFLGTLLLHRRNGKAGRSGGFEHCDIVDGQQRLTTSVVFIAAGLELAESGKLGTRWPQKEINTLRREFVEDDGYECQKFHPIGDDEHFFRTRILRIAAGDGRPAHETPSSRRLDEAKRFFQENVEPDEWLDLIRALNDARVMVYVVNNAADATQIFELQNDRGKRLTDLEALKSFLMHSIYLNARKPDDKLKDLQGRFARIFRTIEDLENIDGAPDEDSILSYYCAGFQMWTSNEWRDPKRMVKAHLATLSGEDNKQKVIRWIEGFADDLVWAYDAVKTIMGRRDTLHAFTDLYLLRKMASFWPLILKCWRSNQGDRFEAACRLMEIFAFRGYAISNMRSDGGAVAFHALARDFRVDFSSLCKTLRDDLCQRYDVEHRFQIGLDDAKLYEADGEATKYLLWKYENHLRRETGKKQPLISWQDYLNMQNNNGAQLSIEHITSQKSPLIKKEVRWNDGDPKRAFQEIALHRLGNLVLDSVSPNAAKGKKEFADKFDHTLRSSIYLSQRELLDYTDEVDHARKPVWGLDAIKKRHEALVEYALAAWDPKKVARELPPRS